MKKSFILFFALALLATPPLWSQITNTNINIEMQDQQYWSSADYDDAFFQGEDEIVMNVYFWINGESWDTYCRSWNCHAPCYGDDANAWYYRSNLPFDAVIDVHRQGHESDNSNVCTYQNDDDGFVSGWAWIDDAPLTDGRNASNWHYNFGDGNPAWLFDGSDFQMRIRAAWRYTSGNTLSDPLHFGTIYGGESRSHQCTNFPLPSGANQSGVGWTDNTGSDSPDIFYDFYLAEASNVEISTSFGETLFDTYLFLYDNDGNLITSDDDSGDGLTSFISRELCAGTYKIAVEGFDGPDIGQYKVEVSANSISSLEVSFSSFGNPNCELADGYIEASPTGGIPPYTFNWSNGGTSSGIYNLAPGNYDLTVTDACGTVNTQFTSITSTDTGAPTMFCQDQFYVLNGVNDEVTITTADIDAGSYDDCNISDLSISQSTFNSAHVGDNIVTLSATDVVGNTATCDAIVTIELNTAVEDVAEIIDWKIFPNPTSGALAVNIEAQDLSGAQLIVTDLYGRQLIIQPAQLGRNNLDLSSFNPGMYLVEVRKGDASRTERVMLQQ